MLQILLGCIAMAVVTLGCIGWMCTTGRGSWVGGLMFGLPVAFLGLVIFKTLFSIELGAWCWIPAGIAIVGAAIMWRGFRTGLLRNDTVAGAFILVCMILFAALLFIFPELERTIIGPFLPSSPIA